MGKKSFLGRGKKINVTVQFASSPCSTFPQIIAISYFCPQRMLLLSLDFQVAQFTYGNMQQPQQQCLIFAAFCFSFFFSLFPVLCHHIKSIKLHSYSLTCRMFKRPMSLKTATLNRSFIWYQGDDGIFYCFSLLLLFFFFVY